ncbi:MAG: hypothetical protein P8N41_04850 [Alphaproteobacteria bacterium]|nr:hypothetical protein [Alphaproteobacteria bacterium]MDG1882552.1 hypothetical protein [Alphaproteobacteria bacterium]MDG2458248.1 hypothetical protein [Alphaproteobacteria bacterium]|tara:strand:+ start:2869 stop:3489 length:621 start_codon:yes stop_codon:yes gene_type:complete
MLEISSNQIYSETYKALRSIDIDWGIAKDSANLCKWLATHNQFFLGSILKTTDLYKSGNISTSVNDNTYDKPLSSALMGMVLVEYVASNYRTWEGYLNSPKFLVAAMDLISHEQKSYLELSDENHNIIAVTDKEKLYVDLNNLSNKNKYYFLNVTQKNKNYNISELNSSDISFASKVNKKCWKKLKSMAFDTYVPESDESKSGAGY